MLPRPASATAGPKELISATVGTSTPSKPTACLPISQVDANSMARSNSRMQVLVTAVFRPAVRFIRSSSFARAAVRRSISARRSAPRPYCWISGRPRRLSSTKAESSPDFVRSRMPSSPLRREVTSGTATPTAR